MLLVSLLIAPAGGAQSPRQSARTDAMATTRVDPISVRAEYASTLLQARRYGEAAAEYRRLLAQQPGNFAWRLNYARALAWGGAYRDAEVELRSLAARARGNAVIEELLSSVRANFIPSLREARAWVAERPTHVPYQLALARAYVRDQRPRAAFAHFDVVLARQPSAAIYGEAADARVAGGDHRGAVILYRRALERAPTDHVLRRSYAAALAANRAYAAAIEQYTVLHQERPAPRLLTERAEVRRRTGDDAGAEQDLQASIALLPTPEAYLALGDLYRAREQFVRSRAAYVEALGLKPNDRQVTTRLSRLERLQRPAFGFLSSLDERPGVTIDGRLAADNAGFAYVAGGSRIGFDVGGGTVLGVGVEPRVVRGRTPFDPRAEVEESAQLGGTAITVGVTNAYHGEELDVRVGGRGGPVAHSAGSSVAQLAGSAIVTYRSAWSLSLEGRQSPAYVDLMAFAPDAERATFPEHARTFAAAASAPLGAADVGIGLERTSLSDGNARSVAQATVRVPVAPGLSLLYSGVSIGFAERSALYWDPSRYVAHALGLEVGARSDDGLALTARVLPGMGRAAEGLTAGDPRRPEPIEPGDARFVGQLAASLDLGVRRGPWRTALSAAYGTGRAGGYQRFDGALRIVYVPE